MRYFALFCLLPFAFSGPLAAGAPDLAVEAVPASPAVHAADTTVTNPDGSQRSVKGPYIAVQIQFNNKSGGDDYTISNIGFSFSAPTDVLEEDAGRDIRMNTLKPYLKISPGQTAMTEVFYLEELPKPSGAVHQVSVSITGWKGTGADAGDEFTIGSAFKAQ